MSGRWTVIFHDDLRREFRALDRAVKIEVGVAIDLLRTHGPTLGRPHVDTLSGSAFANMKELRVNSSSDWYRFAFDPDRRAVFLCGGGKGGVSQDRFYRSLVVLADRRFRDWIEQER